VAADKPTKASEIESVRREEMHRGEARKGSHDAAARERRKQLEKGYLDLIRCGATDEQMMAAIAALGHKPGSPEADRIRRCWREYERGGKP
jgi:hypothetical protein